MSGPHLEVFDEDTRLSESVIWKLQESYFADNGIDSWNTVPFYATSNAFVCDLYSELVLSCLLDLAPTLDPRHPVYIIELGAGTGSFTHRFSSALSRKMAGFRALEGIKIRYVMTDFTPAIVNTWRRNSFLRPHLESGVLDASVFRPDRDTLLELELSGRTLQSEDLVNPTLVIANYVFDTLRHDAFRLYRGQLSETRFRLSRGSDGASALEAFESEESYVEVDAASYYENPEWNAILEAYRAELGKASVLFPLGALEVIQNLRRLTRDNLALFIVDKGYIDMEMTEGHWPQPISHHGSVSLMVNFDAIHRYLENAGGLTFRGSDHGFSLTASLGLLLREYPSVERCRHVFGETLVRKDPFNALLHLQELIGGLDAQPADIKWVPPLLSLIQTCSHDPSVFATCSPQLEDHFGRMDFTQKKALGCVLDGVRSNLDRSERRMDVLGPLLRLYFELERYRECREIIDQHVLDKNDSPWILGYLAGCHEADGRLDLTLSCLKEYRELEPDNDWVSAQLQRIRQLILKSRTRPRARV